MAPAPDSGSSQVAKGELREAKLVVPVLQDISCQLLTSAPGVHGAGELVTWGRMGGEWIPRSLLALGPPTRTQLCATPHR